MPEYVIDSHSVKRSKNAYPHKSVLDTSCEKLHLTGSAQTCENWLSERSNLRKKKLGRLRDDQKTETELGVPSTHIWLTESL